MDPEEMADPRLHWMRQRMRDSHQPAFPVSKVEDVRTVAEILKDHPIVKPLIDNEDKTD
jgi:hypothetical protein